MPVLKLASCMADVASFKRADHDSQTAILAKITDAPSYVIDGKKYLGGAVFKELKSRL